jgi:hypothetical protein
VRRGIRFAAALTIAFAASAGTAWGDQNVKVGPPDLTTFNANGVGCSDTTMGNCVVILGNLIPPSGGVVTVPDDGTLTSWRANGFSMPGGLMFLDVLRPAGGGSYSYVTQAPFSMNLNGTTDNPVSPPIPVQPGDALALQLQCSGALCSSPQIYTQQPAAAKYGAWATLPNPPTLINGELALNATVSTSSPVVTSLSQASGGISGGNTLTITGQHLANATSVSFGSPVTTPVSNSNGQIVVTVPHGETTQTVHVQVTTAGGTSAISSADAYTYLAERKLHVSVSGSGTVTGSGISCVGDCQQTYLDGTQVSLSAAAASGSTFTGWGGACSGTGSCDITMGADHDVSATFTQNPPPPKAPDTKITQATIDSAKGKATFKFKAVGKSTRFQCAIKRKRAKPPPPKACSSPKKYKRLKPGKYLFAVRAVGPGGPDPKPATKGFKIG